MRPVAARPRPDPAPAPDEISAAPTYLTAGQVGVMLQLSAKSIYRLAKQDPTFPQLKLAGSVRFPRERLMRWLRDREQGPGRQRANALSPLRAHHRKMDPTRESGRLEPTTGGDHA